MCEEHCQHSRSNFSIIALAIWVISVIALLFVLGCSSNNSYRPAWEAPAPAIEGIIKEAHDSPIFKYGNILTNQWWELFKDEQLTELIDQGLRVNPRPQIADTEARISQAQSKVIGSALYPQLDLNTDSTRYVISRTGAFSLAPPGSFPFFYTQTELYLNFQWEIDWWQKNLNSLRAALGQVQANIAEAAQSRLLLGLSIAQNYFQYQQLLENEALAQRQVDNYTQTVSLVNQLLLHKVNSQYDVQQIEINLSRARDNLLNIQLQLELSEHALKALLAGQFDEEFQSIELEKAFINPFPLPEALPLDILAFRPDIAAQLWLIESSEFQIEVAKAQFMPNINLLGLFGFQTIFIKKLFNGDSTYGQGGPAIHLPIFEGFRLVGNLETAKEEYTLAILQYEDLLITAVQQVLDGISSVKGWWNRYNEAQQMTALTKANYDLILRRFNSNISSMIDVLSAERDYLTARDNEVRNKGSTLLVMLDLIRATGGNIFADETMIGEQEVESSD